MAAHPSGPRAVKPWSGHRPWRKNTLPQPRVVKTAHKDRQRRLDDGQSSMGLFPREAAGVRGGCRGACGCAQMASAVAGARVAISNNLNTTIWRKSPSGSWPKSQADAAHGQCVVGFVNKLDSRLGMDTMNHYGIEDAACTKTRLCGNSSVVEHNLAKVGVASSNLVSRSISPGWVAEWSCNGLQSRLRRFDSGPSLHPRLIKIFIPPLEASQPWITRTGGEHPPPAFTLRHELSFAFFACVLPIAKLAALAYNQHSKVEYDMQENKGS